MEEEPPLSREELKRLGRFVYEASIPFAARFYCCNRCETLGPSLVSLLSINLSLVCFAVESPASAPRAAASSTSRRSCATPSSSQRSRETSAG